MSKWLNNKVIVEANKELEKPCHSCGYCPYGQLVEEFPVHPEGETLAKKHNLYSKAVKGKGWVKCNESDKGAMPNLNEMAKRDMLDKKYSCGIFGHHCPVFYHAEPLKEDKD